MSGDVSARAIAVIAKTQHLPPESITIDKTFAELKFDSLDGMNIMFAIETEFDIAIPDDRVPHITSVREMVAGIGKFLGAEEAAEEASEQARRKRRTATA